MYLFLRQILNNAAERSFHTIVLFFIWSTPAYADKNSSSYVLPLNPSSDQGQNMHDQKYQLVEEFTANTLGKNTHKLGLEYEYGITDSLMSNVDLISSILGIPSLQLRGKIWHDERHVVTIGIKSAYLDLDQIAHWAPAQDYFSELNANIIRPSIAWTNTFSDRLKLHTFWSMGIGKVNAELSEKGRRRIWQAKHPDSPYPSDEEKVEVKEETTSESQPVLSNSLNQEKKNDKTSNITRRTLELQSLFGLSTDRFQVTGEFVRKNGNKILVYSRIERMMMEDLRANSISMTIAQHWVLSSLQFRIGIGMQYLQIRGVDLDGEQVEDTGINPIPDVSFYWRF